MCNPTTHVPATSNPYPGFSLGPVELPIYLKHPVQEASARATAHQFTMTNVLLPDGMTEGSGTLSAILDAREVYPVFPQLGVGADGDKMCEYLANNAIDTCMPCSDGLPYCLTLTASYLGASVAPITLQETPGYADTCFFN
jgi:hypothetical protein